MTGTQGATTVARLQVRTVAGTAPLGGQVLKFNSTTNQWEPDTDNISAGGGGTITGVTPGTGLSGGGASGNVTLNIANSGVGTAQLADNGVTDAKIVSVSGGKITGAVATATNATNAVNATNATTATAAVNFSGALNGDVTGNQGTTTVTGLRNLPLPTPVQADDGRVLRYRNDGVNPASFELANVSGGGGGTITGVTAGAGLSGGGTSGSVTVGIAAGGVGATELAANAVTTAKLADGSVTDAKIATVAGSKVTGAIPVAGVPAGSVNYIQNTAILQASSNFNVSGNGTVGGTLTAGTLSGNGASLTNLNAANINSGTLSNARLGVIPLANGGTGLSTGPTAAGQFLRSSGAGVWAVGGIQASDLPALAYVAKAGDTMTGTLNLPADGLLVGGNQLALVGGNVGLGTLTPSARLTVSGTGAYDAAGAARFDLFNPAAGSGFLQHMTDSGEWQLATTGGLTRLLVSSGGSVGIGTIGPSSRLDVDGGDFDAVRASTRVGYAVHGRSTLSSGIAVFGENLAGGYAGRFDGKVRVTGVIEKAGGGFKIDHPLDPENKYLVHSFVESPDMKNLYDGTVTTDANGEAEITLPDWFAALNRDFRYQLTCIGVFAQAIIAEEIKDNRFKIKTSLPQVKVSWQVTGTRQDAWAKQNRLPVEEAKPAVERGSYQNPTAFGQPEERSIEWARHPERMKQQKEQREQAAREQGNQAAAPAARPNNQ